MDITERLADLRSRISAATRVSGRPATSVTIVAVSKTHPPEAIRAAQRAGLVDFGENYVQEAVAKITQLGDGPVWHFIGRMQANKTRDIAASFHWVQTVSSLKIAERLSGQRPYYASELQVCIQLQPEPATGRSGASADEVPSLAARIAELPRLKLRGLMFMPLGDLDTDALRLEFRRARQVFDALRLAGHDIDTLSMGMSSDLELAIEEGSTMVRVGTGLFGARES